MQGFEFRISHLFTLKKGEFIGIRLLDQKKKLKKIPVGFDFQCKWLDSDKRIQKSVSKGGCNNPNGLEFTFSITLSF